MSRLDELIAELCPDGVEHKCVSAVCKVVSPKVKIKSHNYLDAGNYPVVDQGQAFISGYTNEEGAFEKGEYIVFGDHTCIVKYVDFSFVQGADGVKVLKADLKAIVPRFLFHCMSSIPIVKDYARHWSKMKKEIIPIPPLPVQSEIVRILDNFIELTTELTTELAAELTARKKQYEYYRDELLAFNNNVPTVILGDIATVTKLAGFEFTKYVTYSDKGNIIALRGLNVKNGKLDLHDVKYVDKSDFSKLTRSKLHVGDMLFTYVGTIGQVALISEEDKYYLAPNVALIRSNSNKLFPEFMKYYFQSNQFFNTQIKRLLQSSSMKNIPMEKIRKFELPIPPITEQKRIVELLDQFDALCNDISSGLPAEIAARQKQYEYYRDKLLTFKELS